MPLSQLSPLAIVQQGEMADKARAKLDALTAKGDLAGARAYWESLHVKLREWIEGEDLDAAAGSGSGREGSTTTERVTGRAPDPDQYDPRQKK